MKRRDNPEEKIQIAIMRHVSLRGEKNVVVAAIPNGGYRSPTEALRLRSGGVRAGMPDMLVVVEGVTSYLELKTETGRLSDDQRVMHRKLSEAGACVETAYGLDDALLTLERWGVLRPNLSTGSRSCDAATSASGEVAA